MNFRTPASREFFIFEINLRGDKKLKKIANPLSRKENIVVQELDDEILIYDLISNKALCLNKTTALVWQASDGRRTITEITDFVGQRLGAPVNENIVWLALDLLSKEKLVSDSYKITEKFGGLSRREAIRKIGLTSAVAIPVIASLTAPVAAQTQTCITGGTCVCSTTGTQGEICTASVPCSGQNVACRCAHENSGNTMGTCVP